MLNLKCSKFFIASALLLLVLCSANTFGQNTQTSKCIDEDYDAQIAEANKGIKFSKNNIEAYIARGVAYLNLIRYEEALKDFNRAIEINPKSEKAFFYRGILFADRANYDQSIADFTIVIGLNPKNADAYYWRGRNYDYKKVEVPAMDDFDKAVRLNTDDFDKAVGLNNEFAFAYYGRGAHSRIRNDELAAKNDFKKAIEIFGRKIELNSNGCIYENYTGRGVTYFVLSNNRQALSDYNKSIENKQNEVAYYYRGMLNFDNENYKAAVADFTKAVELNSQFAESYKERAAAFEKLNEKDKAETDRQKYKELSEKR